MARIAIPSREGELLGLELQFRCTCDLADGVIEDFAWELFDLMERYGMVDIDAAVDGPEEMS